MDPNQKLSISDCIPDNGNLSVEERTIQKLLECLYFW